jgi:8-oxo-dGTP pyrophosphatase MutT (NUDIX family)
MVIPLDRLPPGFAARIDDAEDADAPPPRPAATAVLVRDDEAGPQLLLLKRLRSAGFVPGAFVFPGGRVDEEDAADELVDMLGEMPRGPAPSYWLAAIREVFEETGVLLACSTVGVHAAEVTPVSALARWRDALLSGTATLLDMMRDLELVPDVSGMVYCSHWITPVAEPKRYDTRFFLAAMPEGAEATIDEREMSEAVWVTAADALDAFRRGALPMVFPTIKTVQRLVDYGSVEEMLEAFRGATVPPILPRLVRSGDGIGIVMPDEST